MYKINLNFALNALAILELHKIKNLILTCMFLTENILAAINMRNSFYHIYV